LGIALKVIS